MIHVPVNLHISVLIKLILFCDQPLNGLVLTVINAYTVWDTRICFMADIWTLYIFIRIQPCSLCFFLFYTNSKLHRKVNIHLTLGKTGIQSLCDTFKHCKLFDMWY